MKIYDARRKAASSSPAARRPARPRTSATGPAPRPLRAPPIGTFKGTGGQVSQQPVKCKKGFVRKHGKCVKKPKQAPEAQASHNERAADDGKGGGDDRQAR